MVKEINIVGFHGNVVNLVSKKYQIMSNMSHFKYLCESAGYCVNIFDGRKKTLVADNIVFSPRMLYAFNKVDYQDMVASFLINNISNNMYWLLDDPIYIKMALEIASDAVAVKRCISNFKPGLYLTPESIRILREGLRSHRIKLIFPSLKFGKNIALTRYKYGSIINKLDAVQLNMGAGQYYVLPYHLRIAYNNSAVIATLRKFNKDKVVKFCEKNNVSLIEYSKNTGLVLQDIVNVDIALSRYLILGRLPSYASGIQWFRNTYINCYKYNTLGVCMDKADATSLGLAYIEDVFENEIDWDEAFAKQQNNLKNYIFNISDSVNWIKETFV